MTAPKKPQIINGPCSAAAPATAPGTLQPRRASPAPAPTSRTAKPKISKGARCSGRRPPRSTGASTAFAGKGALIGSALRIRPASRGVRPAERLERPTEVLFGDTSHLVGCPRRVPYKANIHRGSFGHDRRDGAVGLLGDHVRHRARGGGHRHVDVHGAWRNLDSVDKTQVHDVHPRLGILYLPQRLAHRFIVGHQW